MSKLAAVAERLAQTRRWLDQEADRLAARLDQLERRAPAAIQHAHRILDEQQKDLEATEQMIQQMVNASVSLEAAAGSNKARAPQPAGPSQLPRVQPKQSNDAPAPLEPVHRLSEQQKDIGRLERTLQTLATEVPEPQNVAPKQPEHAQPRQPNAAASAAIDSRRFLEEQHKDEGGLERALQTLANKLQGPQPAGASAPPRPRFNQSNDDAPAAIDAARRVLDEAPRSEDANKPAARKLGVVRVA